jgi:hypothetical protein
MISCFQTCVYRYLEERHRADQSRREEDSRREAERDALFADMAKKVGLYKFIPVYPIA